MSHKQLMSIADAASFLGITPQAVWYHIRMKHLRVEKIGKMNFLKRVDVRRFTTRLC